MVTANTSKSAPTLHNPRGNGLTDAAAATICVVGVVVFLRIWGRYRYNSSANLLTMRFGDHRLWVLLSDLTILLSLAMAIVLTVVACVGVYWGMGIHAKKLSPTQSENALKMFYVYQVLYKFAAGISKIATCLLLLAISTSSKQMTTFNMVCQAMIVYIAGYCIACSIATVFQCSLDFSSNWNHTKSQKHCFPKPPFWYANAALNIFASVMIAFLPWWLFYYISYKRKYIVASVMTALSVSEIVFGCVRLYGLWVSSHSLADLTYGAITGMLVSQLEVTFGIMAACIPTVLKITEDFVMRFFNLITGRENPQSQPHSQSLQNSVQLSALEKSVTRKKYTQFGEEETDNDLNSTHSGSSRAKIINPSKDQIKVETSYVIEKTQAVEDEDRWLPKAPASTAHIRSAR